MKNLSKKKAHLERNTKWGHSNHKRNEGSDNNSIPKKGLNRKMYVWRGLLKGTI